jgi:hypothetical protein
LGDFKLREVIRTVKYADKLVALGKEEAVLQSMTGIGRCYGMQMNVEK